MKRLIFIFLLISLLIGSGIVLFADNQGINYFLSSKKLVLVNPHASEGILKRPHSSPVEYKEYTVVKTEWLIEVMNWIEQANEYMDQLLTENTILISEKQALEEHLSQYKKGLFIGGNIGLPLGGDAIIMYQFNRSGIYSQVGYQNGLNINIGYMYKVK